VIVNWAFTMNSLSPDEEVERILDILGEDPGLQLREIHDRLVSSNESSFSYSPPPGSGYNDERYILKGLIEYLNVKQELIAAEGNKWSLTRKGQQEV